MTVIFPFPDLYKSGDFFLEIKEFKEKLGSLQKLRGLDFLNPLPPVGKFYLIGLDK